jgi:hypothetical protein
MLRTRRDIAGLDAVSWAAADAYSEFITLNHRLVSGALVRLKKVMARRSLKMGLACWLEPALAPFSGGNWVRKLDWPT